MMRSLYSGISGLRNHQTRMDVIGNNIANVNTAGYKTSRVIFQDIFSQNVASGMANQQNIGGTNPIQIGLGIKLSSIDVIHSRSAFGRTDRETDMMINGDGFFIVAELNQETGQYERMYTRAGNFVLDEQGYLVTSHGYYVMGYTDNNTGNGLQMGVVDPGRDAVEGISRISIQPNRGLVQGGGTTTTPAPDPADPPIVTQNPFTITFQANSITTGYPAAAVTITVNPGDAATTLSATTLFGLPQDIADTLDNDDVTIPAYADLKTGSWPASTINLRNQVQAVDYKPPIFGLVPSGDLPEAGAGNLSRIRVISEVFQAFTWDDLEQGEKDLLQPLVDQLKTVLSADTLDMIAYQNLQNQLSGVIQGLGGVFPPEEASLPGFGVAQNGDVSVILNNREVIIGRIAVAMFANPEGLTKAGNSLYREAASSGPAVITEALNEGAGSIDAGGLEMSNVDLADQFTDMIVTQRGFQANSRIITVSDTMLEELVNLKR